MDSFVQIGLMDPPIFPSPIVATSANMAIVMALTIRRSYTVRFPPFGQAQETFLGIPLTLDNENKGNPIMLWSDQHHLSQ